MPKPARLIASVALLAPLLSCASTSGSEAAGEPVIVQFTFDALRPETVRIPRYGNVSWVNLAEDSQGIVLFPESIAKAFTCGANLAPYFRKTTGGYESLPIASFEPKQVQLPCPLAAGSYEYEVRIMNTGLGQTSASGPGRTLRGTIVVE